MILSVDMATYDDDENEENKLINEGTGKSFSISCAIEEIYHSRNHSEYKTWKKNSPFLYDMILR